MFRVLHAYTDRLLRGLDMQVPREESLDAWLSAMKLPSATATDDYMTALHYAVIAGRDDIAREMLDRGANIHARTKREFRHVAAWGLRNITVLQMACFMRNQPKTIQLLLARGADPYEGRRDHDGPCHDVCCWRHRHQGHRS